MAFNFKEKIVGGVEAKRDAIVEEIKDGIETRREAAKAEKDARKDEAALRRQYHPTKTVKDYLSVDERHQTWAILGNKDYKNVVFRYSDVLNVEVLQDNVQVTSGSLGSAVVGGLLTGGIGALAGGLVGPKKTQESCDSLQIKITMRGIQRPVAYICFIETTTKKNNPVYKKAVQKVEECMAILTNIMDISGASTPAPAEVAQTSGASAADELMKFKQLLDAGAITQAEYDAKKAQLLGL